MSSAARASSPASSLSSGCALSAASCASAAPVATDTASPPRADASPLASEVANDAVRGRRCPAPGPSAAAWRAEAEGGRCLLREPAETGRARAAAPPPVPSLPQPARTAEADRR